MSELATAVSSFLDVALDHIRQRLGSGEEERPPARTVRPLPSSPRSWFEEAEATTQWDTLVSACADAFASEGHGRSRGFWRSALAHWFRRSGVYLDCLRLIRPDPVAVTQCLSNDIRRPDEHVTLLALIEGVRFDRASLDLGSFAIVKPDNAQLAQLLGIEVNRVFYPHAITTTSRLTNHWYLRLETRMSRRKMGKIYFQDPFGGPLPRRYTLYGPAIETALKRVVLWDWFPDYFDRPTPDVQSQEPWHGFSIPFVIQSSDNMFLRPPSAPPVDKLYYEPVFDASGEEVGEQPGIAFAFDASGTSRVESFLRGVDADLAEIQGASDSWGFLDLALSYVVKGFFAEGLEQLLWHLVALEALFAEDRPGITDRLSRRLAAIYSDDKDANHKAQSAFRELYRRRGELVHGQPFKKEAHHGHLGASRALARVAALQTLRLLAHITKERKNGRLARIPSREELLKAIDVDRGSAGQFAELLQALGRFSRGASGEHPEP